MTRIGRFLMFIIRWRGHYMSGVILFVPLLSSGMSFGAETPRCGNWPVSVPLELGFNGPDGLKVGRDVPVGTVVYEETISAGELSFWCRDLVHSIGVQDSSGSGHGSQNTFPMPGSEGLSWRIRLSGSPEVSGIATRPYGVYLYSKIVYKLGPGAFTLYLVKTGEFTKNTIVRSGTIGTLVGGAGYGNSLGLLANIRIRNESRPVVSSCKAQDVIVVNMGQYVPSDLKGGEGRLVPFNIKLSECGDGVGTIKYNFLATTPILDQAKGLVSLSRGSTAKGVGLRVTKQDGSPIILGNSHRVDGFIPGLTNFDIPFSAAYSRLAGEPLIPGTADAELTFVMTYL